MILANPFGFAKNWIYRLKSGQPGETAFAGHGRAYL